MGKLGESSIDAVEVEGMVANACTPKKKKKTIFVNKTIYIYIYIYINHFIHQFAFHGIKLN